MRHELEMYDMSGTPEQRCFFLHATVVSRQMLRESENAGHDVGSKPSAGSNSHAQLIG